MRKDILLNTDWRAFIEERIWHRIRWSWTIHAEESPVRVGACLLSPERVGTQAQPAGPTLFLDSLVLVLALGRSWTFGVSGEAASWLEFSPPSSCPVIGRLALWLAGSLRQKASAPLAGPERKAGGRSFPWGALQACDCSMIWSTSRSLVRRQGCAVSLLVLQGWRETWRAELLAELSCRAGSSRPSTFT